MSDMPRSIHTLGWRDVREKKSGKYEARWSDENGRARGKTWADKAAARKYADDMANAVLRGAMGLETPNKPIAEALTVFLERRLNYKTTALNARRLNEFLSAMPEIRSAGQITDSVINRFDAILEARDCNPGGRSHHLRIVRAFTNFCRSKNWIKADPFAGFKMPKSDFEGRAVSDADFDKLCSAGWVGANVQSGANGIGWLGGNQHTDSDLWLRRALVLGRETMLRISQVWELTPEDFREPGQLRVKGIKGQETVTIDLTPAALAVIRETLPGCSPGARLFRHWSSVASMQVSVYKKAKRVGLPGLRFHDVCKVSRVTLLDRSGFSIKEISQLSNTTERTLLKHYIKPERADTFAKYRAFVNAGTAETFSTKIPHTENVGLPPQTDPRLHIRPTPDRPEAKNNGNLGGSRPLEVIESENGKVKNVANSRQVPTL